MTSDVDQRYEKFVIEYNNDRNEYIRSLKKSIEEKIRRTEGLDDVIASEYASTGLGGSAGENIKSSGGFLPKSSGLHPKFQIKGIIQNKDMTDGEKLDEILTKNELRQYILGRLKNIVYDNGDTLLHISARADFGGIFAFDESIRCMDIMNEAGEKCIDLSPKGGNFRSEYDKCKTSSSQRRSPDQRNNVGTKPLVSPKDRIKEIIEDKKMSSEARFNTLFDEELSSYINDNFVEITYEGGDTLLHIAAKSDFGCIFNFDGSRLILHKKNNAGKECLDFAKKNKEFYKEYIRNKPDANKGKKSSSRPQLNSERARSIEKKIRKIIEDRSKSNEQKLDEILNDDCLTRYINEHFQDIVYEGGNILLHISALADFGEIFHFDGSRLILYVENADGQLCTDLAKKGGKFRRSLK